MPPASPSAACSQGGGLSLAAAALAPGLVRLCMADMPYLCDIERGAQIAPEAPYTELTRYLELHPERHDEIVGTLRHVDCALLASRIRARCIVSVGLMDPDLPAVDGLRRLQRHHGAQGAVRVPVRDARAALDATASAASRNSRASSASAREPAGPEGSQSSYRPGGSPCPARTAFPSLALAALVLALSLALALSLRGGSGSGTAFAAATAAPGEAIPADRRTLTFSGSGDVELQPDTAVVNVSVHGEGASSDAALAEATTKMKAVLQALRSLDSVHIADADLETQDVSTSRDWEHDGRFVSDQSLSVTIHDPARAGTVIAAATDAGADSVDGPSFSLAEQSAAYRDALRGALADARSKADAAAAAMGVHILGTSTITETMAAAGRSCTPRRRAQGLELRPAGADRPRDRLGAGHRDVRLYDA